MLTVLTSGKAAPGTTTCLWALALTWPRELLAVDADPAGGDVGLGLLAGRATADRGLLSWSVASRPSTSAGDWAGEPPSGDSASLLTAHAVGLTERPILRILLGFTSAAQASSFSTGTWDRLAGAAREVADGGRDLLVDTGRLTGPHPGAALLGAADRVLVVVRPSVRSVRAAQDACARVRTELGDLVRVSALVVGEGPYPAAEVASALGLGVAGSLPHDAVTAAVLSDGARPRGSLERSSLLRAARPIAARLANASPVGAR